MPFTSSDLAAIDAAIAANTVEVRYADRTVTFGSMADLIAARVVVANNLVTGGAAQPVRMVRIYTNPGWGGGENSGNCF